jgi:NADH-quinone oxidoreductase subunit J
MILNLLFYFFSILLLISSLMIITVQNSIYSVLFLVLSFVSASSLLFLLEIEFIALIFIIIYVGAIAVLFLFVVMMLDIKTINLTKDSLKYFPFGSFVGIVFLVEILLVLFKTFQNSPYILGEFIFNDYTNWFEKIDTLTDLQIIGQVLYTQYVLQFLISGFILLLSVIGAVILTIKTTTKQEKTQSIFKQLSRNYKHVLFY